MQLGGLLFISSKAADQRLVVSTWRKLSKLACVLARGLHVSSQRRCGRKSGPATWITRVESGGLAEVRNGFAILAERHLGASDELIPISEIWITRAQPQRIMQMLETLCGSFHAGKGMTDVCMRTRMAWIILYGASECCEGFLKSSAGAMNKPQIERCYAIVRRTGEYLGKYLLSCFEMSGHGRRCCPGRLRAT